jgi:16S rRNA (cytosine1402-N4)-methyltransferase
MHIPVLLRESLDKLTIQSDDTVLDGTVGGGGHSAAICKRLGKNGKLIGIDQDRNAIEHARQRLKHYPCTVVLEQGNFRNLDTILDAHGISSVSKIIFDLGFSALQLENSGRGFSFKSDEPLLMTLANPPDTDAITASTIVNTWSEETLNTILRSYGEEHFAKRIARAIVEERDMHAINTTGALVDIIRRATPDWYHHRRLPEAARTFQALRITVNDELQALKEGLEKGFARLQQNGRIGIIAFHSLEDRIAKHFFRDRVKEGSGILLFKKPLRPTREEIEHNPRSRSATLRVFIKQ